MQAAVINALLAPVVEVFRDCIGVDAELGDLSVTKVIDPPPLLSVTVAFRGGLAGAVTWTFSEDVARLCLERMMPGCDDAESLYCAVAEFANIVTGNATGALAAAGYWLEICPPEVVDGGLSARTLAKRALAVSVHSRAGFARIVIRMEEAETC